MVASDFAERPPWNETLGPVRPRGGPNGLMLRGGRIVAEWGDTTRVDMTFSVAKSYLSILAGLAWDRGLIGDPARRGPPHGRRRRLRPAAQRRHHLAPPAAADLGMGGRAVGQARPDRPQPHRRRPARARRQRAAHRDLETPGAFWEYNDVRVNRLSLALLRVWRRPLPEVFRELVMDPIGASPDWEWHGYRNSYVEIDGRRVQSVSGGGHWGGGVFISARDQARIGLMLLRRGVWGGRRILSEAWIERMLEPCPLYPQLRLSVVAQHRPRALSERLGAQLLRPRRRRQPDLDRSGKRPRRGVALDRSRRDGRLHEADDDGVSS